jgi:hypothetical protein
MIDFYYWPMPNGHKITMFLAVRLGNDPVRRIVR